MIINIKKILTIHKTQNHLKLFMKSYILLSPITTNTSFSRLLTNNQNCLNTFDNKYKQVTRKNINNITNSFVTISL